MIRRLARHLPGILAIVLAVAALAWVAVLVWAPTGLAHPVTTAPGLVARLTYRAAAGLCHQRPERSFSRVGHPLPVCGRCFGAYAGAALGLVAALALASSGTTTRRYRILLGLAAVPTAVGLVLEWTGVHDVGNTGRALSAIPVAAIAGWMVGLTAQAGSRPPDRGRS